MCALGLKEYVWSLSESETKFTGQKSTKHNDKDHVFSVLTIVRSRYTFDGLIFGHVYIHWDKHVSLVQDVLFLISITEI